MTVHIPRKSTTFGLLSAAPVHAASKTKNAQTSNDNACIPQLLSTHPLVHWMMFSSLLTTTTVAVVSTAFFAAVSVGRINYYTRLLAIVRNSR
jgi:hypothetical protein